MDVADVTEEERAQRAEQKADPEDGHRRQEGVHWVVAREELGPDDRGQSREYVEVEPLEHRADGTGRDGAAA